MTISMAEVRCSCGALNRIKRYSISQIPVCGKCHAKLPEQQGRRALRSLYRERRWLAPSTFFALLALFAWQPWSAATKEPLSSALPRSNGPRTALGAEIVQVKYRGPVDLGPFDCTYVTRSSFIHRVCFDKANSYMLINLAGTYYHYCEIDNGTVAALMSAESMGRFYNSAIKGHFDCRTHRIPTY